MLETFCEFAFEAAHKTTPDTPLHGHTFKVRVVLTGEPAPVFGWTHDLREVEPLIEALRRRLDHTCLNDVEGLETPSLENVARWIWRRLADAIPGVDRVEVRRGLEGASEGAAYAGGRSPPAPGRGPGPTRRRGPAPRPNAPHAGDTELSVSIRRLQPRPAAPANEAVGQPLSPGERGAMLCAAEDKIEELLDILLIDHRADPNTRGTPRRVARMLVDELMRGRFAAPPALTDFDNRLGYGGLIVTGPIEVRSTCAHHLMPIRGEAFVGVVPSAEGKVLGLSKYDRVVDPFAARLQTQEELAQQVGAFLWEGTAPRGLAVRISAAHLCRTRRGVRAGGGRMVTGAYFGALAEDAAAKAEFLRECAALEAAAAR